MSNFVGFDRRRFLRLGAAGMAAFLSAGAWPGLRAATAAPFARLGLPGPLLPPDANGVRLPAGFRSRIVARTGEAPVAGGPYLWHRSPDGGACYATEDGGWIYVSNSEVGGGEGGVGALRFAADGTVVDAYPILSGTSVNCAGGPTPWQTWLSCEEHDAGQVYECDPLGRRPAVVRPALGTFKHEAVAIDPVAQCLYLTEDQRDGGFYRFRPANPLPDLSAGTLEIAAVEERDGRRWIRWLPVPDPLATAQSTREQVPGYQPFMGGEGIACHEGRVYFTTKGDNRVWWYDVETQELGLLYDLATTDTPVLEGVDNLVITPGGDVLVAEDGGDMQIVVLTPDHQVAPLLQVVGHERSEVCGPAFDPAHRRLYFSSQRGTTGNANGGMIFEISAVEA